MDIDPCNENIEDLTNDLKKVDEIDFDAFIHESAKSTVERLERKGRKVNQALRTWRRSNRRITNIGDVQGIDGINPCPSLELHYAGEEMPGKRCRGRDAGEEMN